LRPEVFVPDGFHGFAPNEYLNGYVIFLFFTE